eukprot:1577555-Alexandrium_andersonii.AAC.1
MDDGTSSCCQLPTIVFSSCLCCQAPVGSRVRFLTISGGAPKHPKPLDSAPTKHVYEVPRAPKAA